MLAYFRALVASHERDAWDDEDDDGVRWCFWRGVFVTLAGEADYAMMG